MAYDIIGSIAIIKSEERGEIKTKLQKLKEAKELLKKSQIKTVLEKITEVKGRLRTFKTKYLHGKRTLITSHKENNCLFKLNVETCYFSPRMGNDRKEVANKIKKKDEVLVMFAGIGGYPIVIYKIANPKKITAIEISKECNKYFKENIKLNKIPSDKINLIQGDVKKKITKKALKEFGKFDVIVMPRPNLRETFLEQALKVSKRGTKIFYHLFSKKDELKEQLKKLENEAIKLKRKIKIVNIIKSGEIAPYKFRYRVEMNVMK